MRVAALVSDSRRPGKEGKPVEAMSETETIAGTVESVAEDVGALVERAEATALGIDPSWSRRTWDRLAGKRWRQMAVAAVAVCTCAVLAACAWMLTQQHEAQSHERNRAEFVAAARQAVVTLMSIDFNDPQGSVQRIVDNSTGPFRDEFLGAADDFIRVSKDAKVTTRATATAAAVESMTADSAVVLVSASSAVTNAAGADEASRRWRLTVDLRREGDQIKMSKVEFVP